MNLAGMRPAVRGLATPALDPVRSQFNLVFTLIVCFFVICFNIIFHIFTSELSSGFISGFQITGLYALLAFHVCHTSRSWQIS
jgi:hypothetical protein